MQQSFPAFLQRPKKTSENSLGMSPEGAEKNKAAKPASPDLTGLLTTGLAAYTKIKSANFLRTFFFFETAAGFHTRV